MVPRQSVLPAYPYIHRLIHCQRRAFIITPKRHPNSSARIHPFQHSHRAEKTLLTSEGPYSAFGRAENSPSRRALEDFWAEVDGWSVCALFGVMFRAVRKLAVFDQYCLLRRTWSGHTCDLITSLLLRIFPVHRLGILGKLLPTANPLFSLLNP